MAISKPNHRNELESNRPPVLGGSGVTVGAGVLVGVAVGVSVAVGTGVGSSLSVRVFFGLGVLVGGGSVGVSVDCGVGVIASVGTTVVTVAEGGMNVSVTVVPTVGVDVKP
jgi:hypothetical protein